MYGKITTGKVFVIATLTMVGWAWVARKSRGVRRVPGLAG